MVDMLTNTLTGMCSSSASVPQVTNFIHPTRKLASYIKLKCWASQTSWLGAFGLPVISVPDNLLREGVNKKF